MKINLPYIHRVISYALPLSASMLVNHLSGIISMLMVAQLGKKQLAAGALAIPTFLLFVTMNATIFYALSILISHYKGQNKSHEEIGALIKNSFWLVCFLLIPTCFALWHIDQLLLLFGQNPELVALTHRYFHFAALSIIPVLVGSVISNFFAGIGRPKFTFMISTISLPFTLLLSYGFIFGKFHLPYLGLAGITCANFIIQSIVCILAFYFINRKKELRQYAIFQGTFLPDWHLCKNIFKLGFPIGIQYASEFAALSVATYFMGSFGVYALAASQIVSQYTILSVVVILGLSQAVSILSGEAFGKKEFDLIEEYIRSGIVIFVVFMLLIFICFSAIPKILMWPYIDMHNPENAQLIQLGIYLFILAAIFLLIDGIRNIFSGVLRGLHDAKTTMKIGVVSLWLISIPASYVIGFYFHGGPIGLRIGFTLGFVVAVILLWQRFKKMIAIKS